MRKEVNNFKLFRAFLDVTPFTTTLIMNPVTDGYYQQWFLNGDGRITNAAVLLQLDVTAGQFKPGTVVGLFENNNTPNQEWEIIAVDTDKSFE